MWDWNIDSQDASTKDAWWYSTMSFASGIFNSWQSNKTSRDTSKNNADSIAGVVKFFGLLVLGVIAFKAIFK